VYLRLAGVPEAGMYCGIEIVNPLPLTCVARKAPRVTVMLPPPTAERVITWLIENTSVWPITVVELSVSCQVRV
jgi:hypothetical protein